MDLETLVLVLAANRTTDLHRPPVTETGPMSRALKAEALLALALEHVPVDRRREYEIRAVSLVQTPTGVSQKPLERMREAT